MIVGVDVSSHRIDLAWLEDGRPCRWHQELGGPKTHLIDRLRSIQVRWPTGLGSIGSGDYAMKTHGPGASVTDIAIEYPFAVQKPAVAALMATLGVITRQAPPWARVAWPSSQELRAAIGAKNTKQDAHAQIKTMRTWWKTGHDQIKRHHPDLSGWDEHELDALVTCTGWTEILRQQDAA